MRYTIQPGDTLWALAHRFNTTVDELLRLNPHIKDRNKIYSGRELNVPDTKPQPVTPPILQPPESRYIVPPRIPHPSDYQTLPQQQVSLPAIDEAEASQGMQVEMGPVEMLASGGMAALRALAARHLANQAASKAASEIPALLKPKVIPKYGTPEFNALRENVLYGPKGYTSLPSGTLPRNDTPSLWQAIFGGISPAEQAALAAQRERVLFGL